MEWISVKDKLPYEGQVVIAWNEGIDGVYSIFWEEVYYSEGEWIRSQEEEFDDIKLKHITHWFEPTEPQ